MYRQAIDSDYQQVAQYKLKNNQLDNPIWCKTYDFWTGSLIKARLAIEGLRGQIVTDVHEEDGKVLSFFAGFEHRANVTYMIGVVDLDQPDPIGLWRRDAAKTLAGALERGAETIRLRFNDSPCWARDVWAEQEIGFVKHPTANMWKATADTVQAYVNSVGDGHGQG